MVHRHPEKTRSGSADIAGIDRISIANRERLDKCVVELLQTTNLMMSPFQQKNGIAVNKGIEFDANSNLRDS